MLKKLLFSAALVAIALTSNAQLESSLSTFSPYTMYGIGDLSTSGNVASRAMGGIGVAYRSPYEFTYQNPASLSAIPRNTAIFNFAGSSSNYYQNDGNLSTAYNGADLYDLGFAIPLYKGIGFGVSLTPFSSVGYNTLIINKNEDIINNIGRAIYSYYGEGGVSQLTATLGAKVVAGFSVGVSMHYLFGSIDRSWDTEIFSLINNDSYRGVYTTESFTIDKLRFTFGAQYELRIGDDDLLTFGATYAPKSNGDFNKRLFTYTQSSSLVDTVVNSNVRFDSTIPEKIAVGVYYKNNKFGVGFDYSRQDWRGAFDTRTPDISLCLVNDYRLGAQYTPDRYSIRSFFSRITYKMGGRYANSYIMRNGQPFDEWAVNLGFDIPLKMRNFSAFNLALEYGQRGSQKAVIRENFFKVFIGVTLFGGDDLWFVKRRFN